MAMSAWAGYIRVSHVGGRAGDRFHSPDDQAEAITGWARARGEPVVLLPPELDESGGRQDRPILLEALEGIERREYRGLVVAYLSRASRSARHLLEVWDRVEAAGGQVVAVAENIDASTPASRLTRTMLAAIAEHELDLHQERFENLRRGATERGIWQRRQTPRGYDRDPSTRRLVPNGQAEDVVRAFRDRAAGLELVRIADRLGMTPSGARQLLRNRVYLGELRVGEYLKSDAHPALVEPDTFEAAQRTVPRPPRGGKRAAPALLAGLVRCASCGHVMTRGGGGGTSAYICPRAHSGGTCPAPAAVTVALLDAYVEQIALAELKRLSVTASEGGGLERTRADLSAAERELGTYLAAVSAADVGAEAFADGARARREAVDRARDALRGELARQPVIPGVRSGAEVWATLGGHERNLLLRGLLAAVVVRRAGGRGARVPLEGRVRVLAHGAEIVLPTGRGGQAAGLVRLEFPDLDHPDVLRPPSSEKSLQDTGRAREMAAA